MNESEEDQEQDIQFLIFPDSQFLNDPDLGTGCLPQYIEYIERVIGTYKLF